MFSSLTDWMFPRPLPDVPSLLCFPWPFALYQHSCVEWFRQQIAHFSLSSFFPVFLPCSPFSLFLPSPFLFAFSFLAFLLFSFSFAFLVIDFVDVHRIWIPSTRGVSRSVSSCWYPDPLGLEVAYHYCAHLLISCERCRVHRQMLFQGCGAFSD